MSLFKKKVGQLQQWTGEKLGNTSKTETSVEFQQLQSRTKEQKLITEAIVLPMDTVQRALMKTVSTDKVDKLAYQAFADSLLKYAELFDDVEYVAALNQVASTHQKLALEQIQLGGVITTSFVASLKQWLDSYKDYSKLGSFI
jgi:hypothetical protein